MYVHSRPAQARGPTDPELADSTSRPRLPGAKEDSKRAGQPPPAPRCRGYQEPSRPAGSPLGSDKDGFAAGDMGVRAYSGSSPGQEDPEITPYGVTTNGPHVVRSVLARAYPGVAKGCEDSRITPYGVATNGSSSPRACGSCRMPCKGEAATGRAGSVGPAACGAVRQRKLTGRSPALYDFELCAGSTAARYLGSPAGSGRSR